MWLHEQQHTRLLYPSVSRGVCWNSCPLIQWCCLTISSSVALFSFCLQSFPASGSFPMSRLFASGCKTIRTSASASILPMNIQGWFPLGLMVWSPYCPRDSPVCSSTTIQKCSAFFMIQLSYPYMTTAKTKALTMQTFVGEVMSLLFNMLSRFVIAFLPKSKQVHGCNHYLQWFWSPRK